MVDKTPRRRSKLGSEPKPKLTAAPKPAPKPNVVPIENAPKPKGPGPLLMKAAVGRTSSLTPEVFKTIVDVVRAGNYLETAAAYAGVGRTTLFRWLQRGRTEEERIDRWVDAEAARRAVALEAIERPSYDPIEERYVDFRDAVQRARAESHIRAVAHIQQDPSWQSDAWFLERTAPELYGRRDTSLHLVEGTAGPPVKVELSANEIAERNYRMARGLIENGVLEALGYASPDVEGEVETEDG